MKNVYTKRLQITKDQIVEKILNSTEFNVNKIYRNGGLLYEQFRVSSFGVVQIDQYYFEFAEYSGTGSILETIGKVYIEDFLGDTIVKLKLRMSFLPNNISQYTFFISLLGFLIDIKMNPSELCIIFFFTGFGSLVVWYIKFLATKDVLRKFSKTLGTDRKWKD